MAITVRLNKILIYARDEAERLGNQQIRAEHLLLGIIRLQEGSAYEALKQAGCAPEDIKLNLDEALMQEEPLTEPVTRSAEVERILRIAEGEARTMNADAVGSIHLLLAMLHEQVNHIAAYLEGTWDVDYDRIRQLYVATTPRNGNNVPTNSDNGTETAVKDQPKKEKTTTQKETHRKGASATPMLDKFGHDLTQLAREGKLDPVIGRQTEMERVTQILSRRKKNNPILIGEPGVGKSAIVEGLAMRIVRGEAPALQDKRIMALDIASIVAGTTYRGQFEERMKNLIQELHSSPDVILFIDEIHTIIGAGNASGSLDAANILKPALARGELQCIGATTTNEYRLSIEKDGALERRFQKVSVQPATAEETLTILQHLSNNYSSYHHISYTPEAIRACVTMADRYLSDRAFPDKAIDVMDEAGARERAKTIGGKHATVNEEDIAYVVSAMSGIPVQRVRRSESERLRTMAETLRKRVIGQDEAVQVVVKAIQRSRLGLRDPRRPIGTFFFLGPTGVGKTHLAQSLAQELFGSKDALIRFDMSEYMEKHTVSLLVGAPPGYVAHEDGGKLTEAVRRKPYSVLLFDEIEKAHPDIFNVLLQVLDEGRLTDRQGHLVDFRNTIIILTSNVGTRQLKDFGSGIGFAADEMDEKTRHKTLTKALERTFPPEFVNRIDHVITFDELSHESLRRILDIEIDALRRRLKPNGYTLRVSDFVKEELLSKGDSRKYGARPIRRAVQTYLEDKITETMLSPTSNTKTINIKQL